MGVRNQHRYWNGKKGKRVRLVYDDTSAQAKDWNGRQGTVKGCHRGDCGPNDPYVSVWIDTKPDGTPTGGFLWQPPAHCLELVD